MNGELQDTQPNMTVEEVRESLDLTDKGAIRNSIRNCLTVFQNDPYLQGAIRYNILTERIDIVKPLWWEKPTATLNDTDFNYLMLYLEDKYGMTSEKKIEKAISIVADCNKYHPIRDYLNSLKWDGTERIRYALTRYLGAEDSEYTYKIKQEEQKLDPDTKLPLLDENGEPVTEEKEVTIPMFKVVSVFDVSQTNGRPLPQISSRLLP